MFKGSVGKAIAGKGAQAGSAIKPVVKPLTARPPSTPPPPGILKPAAAPSSAPSTSIRSRVTKLTTDLASAERMANNALVAGKRHLESDTATPQALKASLESLERHKTKLTEMQTSLMRERTAAQNGGAAGNACMPDLVKSIETCRGLLQQVNSTVAKLKPKVGTVGPGSVGRVVTGPSGTVGRVVTGPSGSVGRVGPSSAENKAKETKDANAFKPILAKATKDVAAVEDAVKAVAKKAAPAVESPPEGEELDTLAGTIETEANEALKMLSTTRSELNEKVKLTQAYAPEAKKSAQKELSDLQKKLVDASKTCSMYKAFKTELPKIIASKAAVAEITEKLTGHDEAIKKATKLADMIITKDKVEAIDGHLDPIEAAINEANETMKKLRASADAATQSKFTELKKKGEELTKKIDAVNAKIKVKKDVIKSEEFADVAGEKLAKAEAAWAECQDSEMPFLTGLEMLPGEQNDKALQECAEALAKASSAITDASKYVKTRLNDCKRFEADLCERISGQLTPFLPKVQEIEALVQKFKKETAERKMTSIMNEAYDSVDALEAKIKSIEAATAQFSSSDLEDEEEQKITEAIEKAQAAVTEATSSLSEAKKVSGEKQREAKAPPNEPTVVNINGRITAAQEKLNKARTSIGSAEKVVKAKKAITSGEEKVKEAEVEVEKVKALLPAEGSTFTAESVKAFNETCVTAVNSIKGASAAIGPHLAQAPPKAKVVLQGLADRKAEAQKALDTMKSDTSVAREEALSASYVAEAENLTKATETAADGMEEAEKPFLLGTGMPVQESLDAILKCEEAAAAVKKVSSEASNYMQQKTKEVKSVGEALKKAKEGFAALNTRLKAVSTKLVAFEKDLKDRTKSTKMMEAGEKVDAVEAELKKTIDASEPFSKEGAENLTEAEASAPLKVFMDAEKDFMKAVKTTKTFLGARLAEQKDNKEQTEVVKKLQERVAKAQEELAPTKKKTEAHERRALGSILLAEAKEAVGGLDEEVKTVTAACAPLLEHGGVEFLIATSIKTLVTALQHHMKEKELTEDALFEAAGGKPMEEAAFVSYLSGLPESISHDELNAFNDERRVEIFKKLAKDGKAVTLEDFKGMFAQTYVCSKSVSVTNKFETEGSETLCKLEVGKEVTCFGPQKEDAAELFRSECKAGEHQGWVTLRQRRGARFLVETSPLQSFHATMDAALEAGSKAVQKVSTSLAGKMKQGGPAEEGPLKEARTEMAKLKEKIAEVQKSMEELKKKVVEAKRTYAAKERSEVNAHIDARNLKEATPYFEASKAKVDEVDAEAKKAQEAGKSMVDLAGEELDAFATPASVLEAVEQSNSSLVEKATAAKESIKEQLKAVSEVNPQTGGTGEAKKQLNQLKSSVEFAIRSTARMLSSVKKQCATLVGPKLDATSAAIRKYAQKQNLSGEALFDTLKEGDKIPETAFCKLVQSLEDLTVSAEIAKLIYQKIAKDGISLDDFLNYVVVYYKVTKTIAFTDIMEIQTCKTLKKASIGDVLEMLEGPVKDEVSGIVRIRAKALQGDAIEGWVTLSGNQGSDFLEKTKKP